MKKRDIIIALSFLITGLFAGVYYRELSKMHEATYQWTMLGMAHAHFIGIGVLGYLLICLINDKLNPEGIIYKIGMMGYIISAYGVGIMMLIHGTERTWLDVGPENPILSGISGVFHIALAVSMVLIFVSWLRSKKTSD